MPPDADDFIFRTQDGVLIVRFKTESLVNGHDIERMQAAILAMVDAGSHKLILDFKNVRFLSSATLGMLIGILKRVTELRGKLVISHPEHLMQLLQVSKTDRLFTLTADPKRAMEIF